MRKPIPTPIHDLTEIKEGGFWSDYSAFSSSHEYVINCINFRFLCNKSIKNTSKRHPIFFGFRQLGMNDFYYLRRKRIYGVI